MRQADVIVIGAGIIGLSVAWQIARRSKLKVLVLEKDVVVLAEVLVLGTVDVVLVVLLAC